MNSLGTSPITGVWVALLLFLAVGWLVNKIAKRPLMNWAAWLGGYLLAAFMLVLFAVARGAAGAEYLGYHVAIYLVPACIAIAYARSWRKKRPKVENSAKSS